MPSEPHIILIHSDQHRYDCLGANGHPLVQTPHLDRLAQEGCNFSHAFTPTAICTPARASLMTGRWPTAHGCLSIPGSEIYHPANPDLPTFSQSLKQAGYQLKFVGKYHQELVGSPTDWGFDTYLREYDYAQWREEQGLPKQPRLNQWFGEKDPHITAEQCRMAWEVDNVLDMIDTMAASDKPMFMRWDPSEPHLPNIVPEPYFSMYPPEEIPPWPSYADTLQGKPYIQTQQRYTWELQDWTWEEHWAPMVSRYLGEISLLDAQVGRILDKLDQLGLTENTLVIYSTDHGDLCGGHGMIDKHFVMYDDVMRVPLILRWPGRLQANQHCDRFVCHELDLAATFCDAAGCEIPSTFQGKSLLSILDDQAANRKTERLPGHDDIFGTWHGGQFGSYTQRMVRNRQFKYIWNATAEDELYNMQADPGELHNLARTNEHAPVLQQMRHRLLAWMAHINDPILNPWTQKQLSAGLKH